MCCFLDMFDLMFIVTSCFSHVTTADYKSWRHSHHVRHHAATPRHHATSHHARHHRWHATTSFLCPPIYKRNMPHLSHKHTHTLLQTTADTIHTADLCFMCICAWLRLLVFFWVLCAEPFRSNIPETAWNTLSVLVLFLLLAVWNRVAFSSTMKPSDLYNLFRDVFDMFDMFEFCCLFYVCFICLQLLSL